MREKKRVTKIEEKEEKRRETGGEKREKERVREGERRCRGKRNTITHPHTMHTHTHIHTHHAQQPIHHMGRRLYNNQLTGSIPASLSQLTALTWM